MGIRFMDPNEVERFRRGINSDPEFRLAAKFLSRDMLLEVGESKCLVRIRDGVVTEMSLNPSLTEAPSFSLKAPTEYWEKFMQPMPPHSLTVYGPESFDGLLELQGILSVHLLTSGQ